MLLAEGKGEEQWASAARPTELSEKKRSERFQKEDIPLTRGVLFTRIVPDAEKRSTLSSENLQFVLNQ